MAQRPNWFIGWPFDGVFSVGDAPQKVRIFAPGDRHVTSVFLGGVEETVAQRAWALVSTLPISRIDVSLGEVRMFGGGLPSAVSAVVADGAEALIEQIRIHRDLLVDAGLTRREDRRIIPHVTVARIQRSATELQREAAVDWAEGLHISSEAPLDRLALYTWSRDRSRTLFDIRAVAAAA